jgi:hypothetical protein
LSKYPGTTILKEITIDVFMRSVKPQDVERRYQQELEQQKIPYDRSCEGSFAYRSHDTHFSIVIGPDGNLNAEQMARLVYWGRQPSFPPPELVRDVYMAFKGSMTKKRFRGLGYLLGGRQSGDPAKAINLIPACVAWYLREQGGIGDDHRLATLLNREFLAKCGKLEVRAKSGQAIWKSIDKVGASIKRVEFTLQEGL